MLASTIEELRAAALAATDASGHFPAMYAHVTERIGAAAASGRFADADRMESFARAFAGWYTRTIPGEQGTRAGVPKCWQASYDVADDAELMIVQHLLLGINAHVNHDLPQVVVELAGGAPIESLRADFDAVNDVLAETLPAVLSGLGSVSRWVNVVASRGGGRLFDFSLGVARDRAWQNAVRLARLADQERPAAVATLDELVSVLAFIVANPGRPVSWAVAVGRRLEQHDPEVVTRALLGPLA